MNKTQYLRFLNPVLILLLLIVPSVTGSRFHWSLLAVALLGLFVNGLIINKMLNDYENLYRFSYFDSLTKIPNRLSADLYCRKVENLEHLSVGVADLDNLKKTNDEHGHFAGDKLIATFASIFFRCAGDEGFAARNGGDEFIVFFYGEASPQQLQEFCTRLQEEIEANNEEIEEDASPQISYSIGCAYGKDGTCESIKQLISRADQLMYREKNRKKAAANEAAERRAEG